jgi:hypothetical protein
MRLGYRKRKKIYMSQAWAKLLTYLTPLERPLFVPNPLPIFEVPRLLELAPAVVEELEAPLPIELALVLPRTDPRLPAIPRDPRVEVAVPNLLFSSSSSRRRRSSCFRSSSSAALLISACCLRKASASCSAKSSVAPFQLGCRINR